MIKEKEYWYITNKKWKSDFIYDTSSYIYIDFQSRDNTINIKLFLLQKKRYYIYFPLIT